MTEKKKHLIKKLVPKTLFARSLLILIIPVLLIQVASTFIFYDRHWNKVTARLSYALAGEIALITSVVEQNPNPKEISIISTLSEQRLSLLVTYDEGVKLSDKEMEEKWSGWTALIGQTFSDELMKQIKHPFVVNIDHEENWIEVRIQLNNGVLNISLPQRRLFSSSSYIFLLWVFGISTILLIIAILFMRNQIRPIRRLAIAAERFGKGREVQDFKLEGAKEVRLAGQAFLDMRTRIQRQISQRTTMLAGVSHDLRTPITRLKLQLALLGDSPDTEAMKADVSEMEQMIDGYLSFVRGDGDEEPILTNIKELIEGVIAAGRRQGCDIRFESATLDKAQTMIRPLAMKRCLSNVLGNAAKYATNVWVSAKSIDKNKIEIVVEDNGPGIPDDQLQEVFKPFYRVDSSRNVNTGGVGLGLPIAMDIIHGHGGNIWLERSKQGGLAVYMSIPV